MDLRNEALLMLEKQGAILDLAREVSRLMKEAAVPGVVIGGVAVVLHGHLRTTKDIDILVEQPLERMAKLLAAHGFMRDGTKREFVKGGIPVHLVTPEQARVRELGESCIVEGVTIAGLADLIEMKLRTGTSDPLRAQDLADVIGLIRHHALTAAFAARLDKPLHRAFRRLVRLIERDAGGPARPPQP